jgi:hypothetical protein
MKKLLLILLCLPLLFNSCEEDVPNPNTNPNTGTNTGTQCVLEDCNAVEFTVTYSQTDLFNSADGNYYSVDGSTNYCASKWNPACDTALMWDLSDGYNSSKAELDFNMDGTKDLSFHCKDDGQDLYILFRVDDVASYTVNQPYTFQSDGFGQFTGVILPEGMCSWEMYEEIKITFTTIDIANKIFEGVVTATQTNCSTDSDGAYVIEIDFSCDID